MIYFTIKSNEFNAYDDFNYKKIISKDGEKALVRFRTKKEKEEIKKRNNCL